MNTSPRTIRGVSMVEVLVTLLVVSVGLLGTAQLQLMGARSNSAAFQRTQAMWLAADMADRMRANSRGVVTAAGTRVGAYNSGDATTFAGATTQNCTETGSGSEPDVCSPEQMASHETWEWQQNLSRALVNGGGRVCIDASPDNGTPGVPQCDDAADAPYRIYVWWSENTRAGPVVNQIQLVYEP